MRWIFMAIALTVPTGGLRQATTTLQPLVRSYRLQDLSWQPNRCSQQTPVLIPLGAASLEHGPTARAAASTAVVIAPTLTYHYYPAFAANTPAPRRSRSPARVIPPLM